MLYKLLKLVTAVLYVNCNGLVMDKQFLKVLEKFTTFTFKSNNVAGTVDKEVHPLKQEEKFVTLTTLSNNPDGIDVIVVYVNVSVIVVAFGE